MGKGKERGERPLLKLGVSVLPGRVWGLPDAEGCGRLQLSGGRAVESRGGCSGLRSRGQPLPYLVSAASETNTGQKLINPSPPSTDGEPELWEAWGGATHLGDTEDTP